MVEQIPDKIIQSILGKLSDGSDVEEDKFPEETLAESEEHHTILDEITKKGNFEQYQSMYFEHNEQLRYNEWQRRRKREKRIRLAKRLGYAAAILLPLAFASLLWFGQGKPDLPTVPVPRQNIRPGSPYAILTLPGGETIALDTTERKSKELKSGIMTVRDTLEYQSTTEDSGAYHTLTIPRGGEYILKLSDGTKVWLNAETELSYPARFEAGSRHVFLKGEAYFEVARNEYSPFIITTGEQVITVLGTSFGVRAYAEEKRILTTLEQGSVRISTPQQSTLLKPGEQSSNDLLSGQIQVAKVNTLLYTAWHTGKFMFADQSLEDILNTLSRWYNMNISYARPELKKIRFTGELKRYGEIQEFLEKIEHLEKVRFTIQGSTVIVSQY